MPAVNPLGPMVATTVTCLSCGRRGLEVNPCIRVTMIVPSSSAAVPHTVAKFHATSIRAHGE